MALGKMAIQNGLGLLGRPIYTWADKAVDGNTNPEFDGDSCTSVGTLLFKYRRIILTREN